MSNKNYTTNLRADTRSEALITQHKLFQELGTLYRLKINLEAIARPNRVPPYFNGTALQQRVLDAAVYVVYDLIKAKRLEMQSIPKSQPAKQPKT